MDQPTGVLFSESRWPQSHWIVKTAEGLEVDMTATARKIFDRARMSEDEMINTLFAVLRSVLHGPDIDDPGLAELVRQFALPRYPEYDLKYYGHRAANPKEKKEIEELAQKAEGFVSSYVK